MTLQEFFYAHPKVALGFSGGVDSSYLLYAGRQYGADIRPYFVNTAFQPAFEREDAERLAEELGVKLRQVPLEVLADDMVRKNGPQRCYYCKQAIFGALRRAAQADGYEELVDGSNASDDAGDRPGMRALEELRVLSPLRLCGIAKAEVRRLSREAGLFTWDKPAYACLATRVPTGTPITLEDLARVEQAESLLFRLGFADFRVRLLDGAARIQLPEEQMAQALVKRKEILEGLGGFPAVLLDLQPRPAGQ